MHSRRHFLHPVIRGAVVVGAAVPVLLLGACATAIAAAYAKLLSSPTTNMSNVFLGLKLRWWWPALRSEVGSAAFLLA